MTTRIGFVVLFVSSLGCASIIKGGGPQSISIRSSPSDANVTIYEASTGTAITSGRTPYTVALNKSRGFFSGSKYRVVVEKPGFAPREAVIDSNVSGWYVGGNLLFGGLIGWLIVDPATGAMWTLSPEDLSLDLQQKSGIPLGSILLRDDTLALDPALAGKLKPVN
ncbi:MAG: PEGA domain-containing protein [Myxococcales bacterium]|nr:PEGA domain-containing protein [Myxococcales bacterium]